jgi:hypothetical protein
VWVWVKTDTRRGRKKRERNVSAILPSGLWACSEWNATRTAHRSFFLANRSMFATFFLSFRKHSEYRRYNFVAVPRPLFFEGSVKIIMFFFFSSVVAPRTNDRTRARNFFLRLITAGQQVLLRPFLWKTYDEGSTRDDDDQKQYSKSKRSDFRSCAVAAYDKS